MTDRRGLVVAEECRMCVGFGEVNGDECESWGDGFPVTREGQPLRNLPTDWHGVDGASVGYGVLSPPTMTSEGRSHA